MLRDPALIALSRQHQHALALCVFLQRALVSEHPPAEVVAHWEGEVSRMFKDEIQFHFRAEEIILFPAADAFPELRELTQELRRQHDVLRTQVAAASAARLGVSGLLAFSTLLNTHVRLEERELFESMQQLVPPDKLADIGARLTDYFDQSDIPPNACGLPFNPLPQK